MSERGAADIEFSVRRCANVVASVPLERMVVMVMQLLVVVTRNALMELLREFLGADHSALSIGIFMEGNDERQNKRRAMGYASARTRGCSCQLHQLAEEIAGQESANVSSKRRDDAPKTEIH